MELEERTKKWLEERRVKLPNRSIEVDGLAYHKTSSKSCNEMTAYGFLTEKTGVPLARYLYREMYPSESPIYWTYSEWKRRNLERQHGCKIVDGYRPYYEIINIEPYPDINREKEARKNCAKGIAKIVFMTTAIALAANLYVKFPKDNEYLGPGFFRNIEKQELIKTQALDAYQKGLWDKEERKKVVPLLEYAKNLCPEKPEEYANICRADYDVMIGDFKEMIKKKQYKESQ